MARESTAVFHAELRQVIRQQRRAGLSTCRNLPPVQPSYALLARFLRRVARVVEAHGAIRYVRNAPLDVGQAYDFIESFRYGELSFAPMQIRAEFERLLHLVAELAPARILEIGSARGGTLFLWTRIATEDAIVISVDQPEGAFGGSYTRAVLPVYRAFVRARQKIALIRGDSHEPAILRRVEAEAGGQLDVLFIDGDHTYEGVQRDFEMYSPLIRNGGVIAFHDIATGPLEAVGGVPRFWRELKTRYSDVEEIVESWEQGGYGIGLLRTPPLTPAQTN
jgi:predicted O-methyltransferase YrrM